MKKPKSRRAKRDLAHRLREALEELERGDVEVYGGGHSLEGTMQRLRDRIEELDPGGEARRSWV